MKHITRITELKGMTFNEMIPERKAEIARTEDFVRTHFTDSDRTPGLVNGETKDILHELLYKDDSWNHIRFLHEYMDSVFHDRVITIEDNEIAEKRYSESEGTLKIDSPSRRNNWICFFYSPEKRNYRLDFDYIAHSCLEEVQVAFRLKNLGERYRFMIWNQSDAVFECVHRGIFYWNVRRKKHALKTGEKNSVSVVVNDRNYQYYINGELIFSVDERDAWIDGDRLVIIFYNKDDENSVTVDLTKCEITYLPDASDGDSTK